MLNVWITSALALGASGLDPPRQEPSAAEAWLLDPEHNRLLVLVLPGGSGELFVGVPRPGEAP